MDKPEFKCRGGCGYYGNPNWEGYCSKCKKKCAPSLESPVDDRFRTPSFSVKPSLSTPPASPSLSRVDSPRNSTDKSASSSILKKSSSQVEEGPSGVSSIFRSTSVTRPKQGDRFSTVLRALPKPVSSELDGGIQHFLRKLHSRTFVSIDELAEFVQKFYVRLEEKLGKNAVYSALPSQVRSELWDEIETHICLRLYKTVFAHLQDEEADLALHNKLRSLIKELKPSDLELPQAFADSDDPIVENDDSMKHLLDDAFMAIIDMTTKSTPVEIFNCLSACCQALFNALRAALPNPPSADDFLPALIYCVIRTNPPQIHSTIAYVERFALPRRILDGEAAYYFTNLCCAVRYLDTTDAEAIKAKKDSENAKQKADDEAAVAEAAERGCSVINVKTEKVVTKLESEQDEIDQTLQALNKNLEETSLAVETEVEQFRSDIASSNTDAKKAIEQQLIDFSEPDSGKPLQLYALGTMDAEAEAEAKQTLVKSADESVTNNSTDVATPLIDFESEVSQ